MASFVHRWTLAASMIAGSFLILAVQAANFDADFYLDDYQYLLDASRFHRGRLGTAEYVLLPQNDHSMPLWRCWYYFQWRLFGLNPRPWHAVVVAVHWLSAALLYVVVLQQNVDRIRSAGAAFLWAAACFGSWDNPLTLICASHFSLSLTLFLLAMACMTKASSLHSTCWASACAASTTLAAAAMGSMLLLLPGLALQLWFYGRDVPAGRRWIWASAIFAPVFLVGALEAYAVRSAQMKNDLSLLPHVSLAEAVVRTGEVYATSLGNLLYWPTEAPPRDDLSAKIAVSLGVAFLALLSADDDGRRWMLVFLAASAPATFAASLARRFIDTEQFLSMGRYRFLPTLWWCVVLSVLAAGIVQEFAASRRRWAAAVLAVFLAAVGVHQIHNARLTRIQFDRTAAAPNDSFTQIARVLQDCSRFAEKSGAEVTMPDLAVEMLTIQWRLSDVEHCVFPEGLSGLSFMPVRRTTELERTRSLHAVRSSQEPIAKGLEALIAALPIVSPQGQGVPQSSTSR